MTSILVAIGAALAGWFLWRKSRGAPLLPVLSGRTEETSVAPVTPVSEKPPTTPALTSPFRVKSTLEEAVSMIALAIAKFETGDRSFSLLTPENWKGAARRNLNPGNLRGGFQRGSTGVDGRGYSIFASAADGWSALRADVRAKITGRTRTGLGPESTLSDFFRVYAPDTENPTARYISFVASLTKVGAEERFRDWIEGLA